MRRSGRDPRRPDIAAVVEGLEPRELLSTAPLGTSLPDLVPSGFAAPVGSWGGPLSITVNLQNIGSSEVIEPLALAPGSVSSADAPSSIMSVYAVRDPRNLQAGRVLVGTFAAPPVAQNAVSQFTRTITLPARPAGFPAGGPISLILVANATNAYPENDVTNNVSRPIPVTITSALPSLAAVALDVPPTMQPGDTIQPNIRIANYGPADTNLQGPLQVALVASTTPNFNSGSSIVAVYTVANVPGQSLVPTGTQLLNGDNLTPPRNVVTITGAPVTLPASPSNYFLGVVIDPANQIRQVNQVPNYTRPANPFTLVKNVGPYIMGLPPAGVQVAGGVANTPVFPFPFGGNPVGGLPGGAGFPPTFPPNSVATLVRNNVAVTGGVYSLQPYGASFSTLFQNRRAVVNALRNPTAPTMADPSKVVNVGAAAALRNTRTFKRIAIS